MMTGEGEVPHFKRGTAEENNMKLKIETGGTKV